MFHVVQENDLEIALKYTCDYRRYNQIQRCEARNKHPLFYSNIQSAVSKLSSFSNSCVLVVNKIPGTTETQSDYYIQYVVDFK